MKLILFFTRSMSLSSWAKNGSLDRELALYNSLIKKGVDISFLTYGGPEDLIYQDKLSPIKILCNAWKLPKKIYELLLPVLFSKEFSSADIFKTNQTNGAEIAFRIAKLYKKPWIARLGYMWSEFFLNSSNQKYFDRAKAIERVVFSNATKIVVTTIDMKTYVISNYLIPSEKINIIPNYVSTSEFITNKEKRPDNIILFVGRFEEQKNLISLIEACKGLDVELHLVGSGSLEKTLLSRAQEIQVRVTFHGNVPHLELPKIIHQATIFALVSHFEGHPKALIEAMACGSAVLGTNVPGIREIIQHGENGWLCEPTTTGINQGIITLLADPELRENLGLNARNTVENNFSLEKIVNQEFEMHKEIIGK